MQIRGDCARPSAPSLPTLRALSSIRVRLISTNPTHMKTNKALLITILGCLSIACGEKVRAEAFTFDTGMGVGDFLEFSKHRATRPYITIEEDQDGDVLAFRSEGGAGDLALFQPPGSSPTKAREIEVILSTEGTVSFGVFSRASAWEEQAYLVFFSPDPDGTARLSLGKTQLTMSQKIGEGRIASEHAKGVYEEGSWYALRIKMNDDSPGVVDLRTELVNLQEDRKILSVTGEDKGDVLLGSGPLGLRFFCGQGGVIRIRSITVSE
jgi:hypothetical protein